MSFIEARQKTCTLQGTPIFEPEKASWPNPDQSSKCEGSPAGCQLQAAAGTLLALLGVTCGPARFPRHPGATALGKLFLAANVRQSHLRPLALSWLTFSD